MYIEVHVCMYEDYCELIYQVCVKRQCLEWVHSHQNLTNVRLKEYNAIIVIHVPYTTGYFAYIDLVSLVSLSKEIEKNGLIQI